MGLSPGSVGGSPEGVRWGVHPDLAGGRGTLHWEVSQPTASLSFGLLLHCQAILEAAGHLSSTKQTGHFLSHSAESHPACVATSFSCLSHHLGPLPCTLGWLSLLPPAFHIQARPVVLILSKL